MGLFCEPFKLAVKAALIVLAPAELATAAGAAQAAKGVIHVLEGFGVTIPEKELIDKIIADASDIDKLTADIGKMCGIC